MNLSRALFALACLAASLAATASTTGDAYRSAGWHFYQRTPEKPKAPPVTPAKGGAGQGTPVLSSSWIRANLQSYLDRAMDTPTKENLELYGLLQRMSLDKADRFATAYQQMVATTPHLDESVRNPVTALAKGARRETMEVGKAAALTKIASQAGLYFFFRSDCPYCHRQAPLLETVKQRYGLAILPISLDGLPLATGQFPNFVPDNGQGAALGVQAVPMLVLVRPPKLTVTVSVGIRTLPEIETRLLDVGLAQNLITQAEYDNASRGVPEEYYVGEHIPAEQLAAADSDPETLLLLLRSAAVSGGSTSAIAPPGGP